MSHSVCVTCAVEGFLDEVVVRRLCREASLTVVAVHGLRGKPHLLSRLGGYNEAARISPWVVIVDLDNDADCAPLFAEKFLPQPSQKMCLRFAVRSVDSWLLADREGLAPFLGVSLSAIPPAPDELSDPKRTLVDLARRSRKRSVTGMIPSESSGRREGPEYATLLAEMVLRNLWSPSRAADQSPSLRKCLSALKKLSTH